MSVSRQRKYENLPASGNIILGAGMSGLALGAVSGLPVYEAAAGPGGICSSYYLKPGTAKRLPRAPEDGNSYRFEYGGGALDLRRLPGRPSLCPEPDAA